MDLQPFNFILILLFSAEFLKWNLPVVDKDKSILVLDQ